MNKLLKNILIAFLFLAAGGGLAAISTIPVSKTEWSNEIRAQVAARRAARHKKAETVQNRERQGTEAERGTSGKQNGNAAENKNDSAGGRPRKPKPKPAELSWKAAKDIPVFFALCGIPFLITAGITFSIQKRKNLG